MLFAILTVVYSQIALICGYPITVLWNMFS